MKVPNEVPHVHCLVVSLSRLQNEGSQRNNGEATGDGKSIKATE